VTSTITTPDVVITKPSKSKARSRKVRKLAFKGGLRIFVVAYLALLVAVPVGAIAYKAFEPGFGTALKDLTNPSGL